MVEIGLFPDNYRHENRIHPWRGSARISRVEIKSSNHEENSPILDARLRAHVIFRFAQ